MHGCVSVWLPISWPFLERAAQSFTRDVDVRHRQEERRLEAEGVQQRRHVLKLAVIAVVIGQADGRLRAPGPAETRAGRRGEGYWRPPRRCRSSRPGASARCGARGKSRRCMAAQSAHIVFVLASWDLRLLLAGRSPSRRSNSLLDTPVAFAGPPLEGAPVDDRDVAARVADDSGPLQHARRRRHAGALHAPASSREIPG